MASDLERARNWLAGNTDNIAASMDAALELLDAVRPQASGQGITVADLFTGDPIADRRIADAVGIASIAGRHNLSVEVVLDTVNALVKVATAIVSLA
jgi:hypothetical protein